MKYGKFALGIFVLAFLLGPPPAATDVMAEESGTYNIDAVHSHVGFAVRHLGISKVRGRFNKLSGTVVYDAKDVSKSSVEVVIEAASIDTQNEKRDAHLKNEDFFDVEKYPEIKFKSKKISKKGDEYELVGDLTMHGVTKEVTIPFELVEPMTDPYGMLRLGAEGRLSIDRQSFGIKFDKTMDTGGLIVGNTVEIEISIEATKG